MADMREVRMAGAREESRVVRKTKHNNNGKDPERQGEFQISLYHTRKQLIANDD